MKTIGIDNTKEYIVRESSPVLLIKNSKVDEADKRILKGTVVEGALKTRVINIDGEKVPYKFIQIKDSKEYISPQVVDVYINDFEGIDGENVDKNPVRKTAYGEDKKTSRKQRIKRIAVNYGLPLAGAVIGYKVAEKKGGDMRTKVGYVLFFTLLGALPRILSKNK